MTSGMLASSLGIGTLLCRDRISLLLVSLFARLGCLLKLTPGHLLSAGGEGACGIIAGGENGALIWAAVGAGHLVCVKSAGETLLKGTRVGFDNGISEVVIGGRGGVASLGGGGTTSGRDETSCNTL